MVTKKMFDTNKNVTKRGVIIKGVYCGRFWGYKVYQYIKKLILKEVIKKT
jgi:hypothetical protein